jgi:hypothetical protein
MRMNRISKGLVCVLLSLPWPAAADRVLELEDDADGVVDGRVVLTSTLRLPSGTHLNCKGLRLVPSATGRPDVRGTAAKEYIPSVPEVGILVLRAEGVKIQDCKIGDVVAPFDFPVLVLDSKGPRSPNRILDNEIAGRYGGVMLIKSDRVHVIGNQVTFGIAAHGRGIGVYRDSDDNVVLHNTIVAHSIVNQTNFPLVPQAPTLADAANSRGIFSTALANGVLSFSFDGEPTQISLTEDMIDLAAAPTWLGTCDVPTGVCCEDRDDEKVCFGPPTDIAACRKDRDCGLTAENMTPAYLSERNLYQSNIIDFSPASEAAFGNPGLRTFGIVDIGSADDLIVGNTITRVDEGIHFGAAGHDFTVVVGPTGEELRNVNIGVTRVLVMGNTVGRTDDDELYGARSFGILAARGSMKVSLVGNTVTRSDTGIAIRQNAPNDTLVAGNFVHGNRFSFGLDQGFGVRAFSRTREYGATVTMNDFTGATKAAVSPGCARTSSRCFTASTPPTATTAVTTTIHRSTPTTTSVAGPGGSATRTPRRVLPLRTSRWWARVSSRSPGSRPTSPTENLATTGTAPARRAGSCPATSR